MLRIAQFLFAEDSALHQFKHAANSVCVCVCVCVCACVCVYICAHDLPEILVKLLMWGASLSSTVNSRQSLNSVCVCVHDLPKMQVKCAEVGSFAELHGELKTDFEFRVYMCA